MSDAVRRYISKGVESSSPLSLDQLLVDAVLLIRGAILASRLVARTLHLQHISVPTRHMLGTNTAVRTFRRLQLTHALETRGPRLIPGRGGDVIAVDSLFVALMVYCCDVSVREKQSARKKGSRISLLSESNRLG